MRQGLEQRIQAAGLGAWCDLLCQRVAPAIGLIPRSGAEVGLGAAKFGGDADVPPDFAWPLYRERPLSFVGQIDLAAVSGVLEDSPLPGTGLLSFFYEGRDWGYSPRHRGSARVFHFAEGTVLERTAPPPGPVHLRFCGLLKQRRDARRFRECEVVPAPVLTLKELGRRDLAGIDEDQLEALVALEKELGAAHHLLGHPQPVQQDEMALECQLVTHGLECGGRWPKRDPRYTELARGAAAWRLLLQVESETEHSDMTWCDVGTIYFWIREEDLRAGNFAACWLICQST